MRSVLWFLVPAGLAIAPAVSAQAADSAAFAQWHQANQRDLSVMHRKVMALAGVVPDSAWDWRPMDGVRSFREVFAHIATEAVFESPAFATPARASGDFDAFEAEEHRIAGLPRAQLVALMDSALASLASGVAALRYDRAGATVPFYGRDMLPQAAVSYASFDLHEHLGQLIAYCRMNRIVPPWSQGQGG